MNSALFLASFQFKAPTNTVIHNVTADACNDPDVIRQLMARQLVQPGKMVRYDLSAGIGKG